MKTSLFAPFIYTAVLILSGMCTSLKAGAIKFHSTPGDMSWPGGRVPYVFKPEITEAKQLVFKRCVRAWQRFGNIRFVPTTENFFHYSPAGNYLLVQNNNLQFFELVKDVNYAYIGRCGYILPNVTGMQPMSISELSWQGDIVVHELGHVLGMIHEQMRPNRDEFVTVVWENINPVTNINWNIETNSNAHATYDYESVMHYDRLAFQRPWKTETDYTMYVPGNLAMTNRIGLNKYYPPNADDKKLGEIGKITALLSNKDRLTISTEYGQPTNVMGTVLLPNGKPLPGVSALLVANGGSDEVDFINLMSDTNERSVSSKKSDGKFQFLGVPTGNYKVLLSKSGFSLNPAEVSFTGGAAPTLTINATATNTETTPPTGTITTPPQEEVRAYHTLAGVAGTAKDTGGATLKEVRLTVKKDGVLMNWNNGLFEPGQNFYLLTSFTNDIWSYDGAQFNGLPEGEFTLAAVAVDFSNNESEVEESTFRIDKTVPTIATDPAPELNERFFDFKTAPLGGPVNDTLDPAPVVTFTIIEDNALSTDRFWIAPYWDGTTWAGSDWTTNSSDPHVKLKAKVEGGRWQPDSESDLPTRGKLRAGLFTITAAATDKAGNTGNASNQSYNRTPLDTTVPNVAFLPSRHNAIYTEHTMPPITGVAVDDEGYIQGMELYLMRLVPNGGGFVYWNGESWQNTQVHLAVDVTPVPGNEKQATWSAPGLDYPLPSGADLPDGAYQIQVAAHNRESPQVATTLITEVFHVAVDPPRVDVTSVTHNGAKAGWTLGGTVTDTAVVGFSDSNRVSLTINRDGLYWDGDEWTSDPSTVYADILPDSTWVYPGATPDAQMPTGDGSYSVSAHVRDNNGNVNAVIAGGLFGNNQLIFTVDATPPLLALASPAVDTIISASPLPAGWIHGTSSDSSGPVTVTFRLKRLPSVVFNDFFWNGEIWKDSPSYFSPDELDLVGTFPADNGPTSWKFTGHQPKPGWDFNHCLINGAYEVVVVAKDLAGNETTLTRALTVDYHPQYIPPEFEHMPLQLLQTPPFPTSALGGPNPFSYNPLANAEDERLIYAQKLLKRPGQPYYVASHLYAISGQGESAVVLQRLGATPWRLEYTSYASTLALEADLDGNLYALYKRQTLPELSQLVLVKYTSAGDVVWARDLPDDVFNGTPTLKKLAWLPDGSLGMLFAAMVVIETDGDVRFIRRFGIVNPNDLADPANFESAPVDFAGDAAGNVFLASIETDRLNDFSGNQAPEVHRTIRKLSSAGTTMAINITDTCDFPELWDKIATDPAGNVYVSGRFMSGVRSQDDLARQEMLKFDSNLTFLWRAFGPARSPDAGDAVSHIDAGTDGVMTIDNSGMAAFFTSAGALKWARPIIEGGGNSYLFTFAGGSAVGILYTGSPDVTAHLVKISRAGDTQFDLPFTSNPDQIGDFCADTSDIFVLRQGSTVQQPYVESYYNIPDATIPVTLDPVMPRDQILIAGDEMRLQVVNSGTLATGYQWRKDNSGTPGNISGATSDTFILPSTATGDAGLYSCLVTNPNGSVASRSADIAVLPAMALDVALDAPGRVFTIGGDSLFGGFTVQDPHGPTHDNVDAVMNRPIGPSQSTFIETTVTGPGSVTFWWKADTDFLTDEFSFAIDGDSQHSIRGEEDWTSVTRSFGSGTHTLRWDYHKAGNSTSTDDYVWLDNINLPTTLSLAEALDTPGLTWATSAGDMAWTGVSSPSHDGADSAVSGNIGHNQQSYMETTVTGPGTLTFWWKISSEDGPDRLKLTVDGSSYGSTTGIRDWEQVTRPISAGTHTLRWSYEKDDFFVGGEDRAWVDQVVFAGEGGGPEIVVEQPELTGLNDNASTIDFGTALAGNNVVKTFTIRNTGTAPLLGLVVTRNGTHDTDFTLGTLGQTSLDPGQPTTFTVTFAPGGPGVRTAAIHIQSNDIDENTFDINLTATGGIPIADWRQTYFGSTANTGEAADTADWDKDGVSNLMEFATGSRPDTRGTASTPFTAPAEGLINFTYTRNKQAMAELTFQVQWSDSLTSWSSVGVTESILSDNGLLQQVQATLSAGAAGRRFVSLKVTRP